jgi:hypothetical protein
MRWITRMISRSRCWLLKILDRHSSMDRSSRLVTGGGLGSFVEKGISIFENPFSWPTFAGTINNIRVWKSR